MTTPAGLSALAGHAIDTDQATAALQLITTLAKSYTRGQGWGAEGNPAEDLEAVITSATIRYLSNVTGVQRESLGGMEVVHGTYLGWSIAELAVLNRYRERAQ